MALSLDDAKKLIMDHTARHVEFVQNAETAERYFKKQNDILHTGVGEKSEDKAAVDAKDIPMRSADNRIPSNFYKLLLNQKTAYAFTAPPVFDVGSEDANSYIMDTLGDSYKKKCAALCKQAGNAGIGWIHYWEKDRAFKYAVVDAKQIIPIFTDELEPQLMAALRVYKQLEEADGAWYVRYELWTSEEARAYTRRIDDADWLTFAEYKMYSVLDIDTGMTSMEAEYKHNFEEVPFIFFLNNEERTSDLKDIKELIDAYDKVYSGFINDLEDIQEIIFVLTNYGGAAEEAAEILREIKTKKLVQVENEGGEDRSGLSTLAIDIPVEAREKVLTLTRKSIFEQGMGIDPDPQNFGNSSGVALGFLYSLLELKTGMMQTQFEASFNRLVRAILRHGGQKGDQITQVWTRTSVRSDMELADIAQKSVGVISKKTIVRNHPWVESAEEEMKELEEEAKEGEPEWEPPAEG